MFVCMHVLVHMLGQEWVGNEKIGVRGYEDDGGGSTQDLLIILVHLSFTAVTPEK